jgi:hypothetical protein
MQNILHNIILNNYKILKMNYLIIPPFLEGNQIHLSFQVGYKIRKPSYFFFAH